MPALKAIIIDDEPHAANRLSGLLKKYNSLSLEGEYLDLKSAVAAINEIKPDVLFLDVHLNNETGFDLLSQLPARAFEVIFTTAHDKYAINAFKFSAIDYLLKPIDRNELSASIEKLLKKISLNEAASKLDMLMYNINSSLQAQKITLPTENGLHFIPVQSIIRCQADTNYTHFFINDGSRITVSRTLKMYEEMLNDYGFVRVHNSHLVNITQIEKYSKGKGGSITMSDGSEIEVSVRKKEQFLKRIALLK